jgi:hypothetical protein
MRWENFRVFLLKISVRADVIADELFLFPNFKPKISPIWEFQENSINTESPASFHHSQQSVFVRKFACTRALTVVRSDGLLRAVPGHVPSTRVLALVDGVKVVVVAAAATVDEFLALSRFHVEVEIFEIRFAFTVVARQVTWICIDGMKSWRVVWIKIWV